MLRSGLCASLGLDGLGGAMMPRVGDNVLSKSLYSEVAGDTGFDIDACMDVKDSLMIAGGVEVACKVRGTLTDVVMVVSDQCFLLRGIGFEIET